LDRLISVLVLPDGDERPPGPGEPIARISVTSHVPVDLGSPVLAVGSRRDKVLRAAMPEAPPDFDRDASTREDDVDLATQAG
jgi:hypothetical protein